MLGPLVQGGGGERAQHPHHVMDRIVRQVGIGGVALGAVDDHIASGAAAPPDLDHVAQRFRVGRLADDAGVELFAAFGQPFQHLARAVDGGAFLVAGDKQADGAGRGPVVRRAVAFHELRDGCGEARDRALHVGSAAPV